MPDLGGKRSHGKDFLDRESVGGGPAFKRKKPWEKAQPFEKRKALKEKTATRLMQENHSLSREEGGVR